VGVSESGLDALLHHDPSCSNHPALSSIAANLFEMAPRPLDLVDFRVRGWPWEFPKPKASEDPFFFKAFSHWKPEQAYFLLSTTDIDDDEGDHLWEPVRPLGQGGFGIVGLWEKRDEQRRLVDSMAIKQQRYMRGPVQELMTDSKTGLSKEAFIMYQLNQAGNENIILLRSFKDNDIERLWRFYLEYSPGGDLEQLRSNYIAWNTYLPEPFLWHVFEGLASAASTLHTGPFNDPYTGETLHRNLGMVIHLDLKPANILLGDVPARKNAEKDAGEDGNEEDGEEDQAWSEARLWNYPTVKMADFGLAKLTHPNDKANPESYRRLGTSGYRPPVSLMHIPGPSLLN
jgi:serine/threonine protein kinase